MAETTTKRWELPRLWQACAGIGVPSFISSLSNKRVDGELSISEIMVKAHRGKVMQKKQADLSLVRMAAKLRLATTPRR